ncbi:hypothetical protein EDD27_4833 [Nonomuraea polychroma]|uniref:Uncharacterized protein n=1 Tax=Nonomuraea polychroma TaxID=46176 RepID=A0A438M915_9ACTN|nr:hypothetical protein [Nonomuraea polychroma]RVX42212.1 hypothetical protein EDD27_4833 [Nonomuraea polychroma]
MRLEQFEEALSTRNPSSSSKRAPGRRCPITSNGPSNCHNAQPQPQEANTPSTSDSQRSATAFGVCS